MRRTRRPKPSRSPVLVRRPASRRKLLGLVWLSGSINLGSSSPGYLSFGRHSSRFHCLLLSYPNLPFVHRSLYIIGHFNHVAFGLTSSVRAFLRSTRQLATSSCHLILILRPGFLLLRYVPMWVLSLSPSLYLSPLSFRLPQHR